jgi:hypothetical protein
MFYVEEEIAGNLTCPQCKSKYVDPRLIPCMDTLCNSCIQVLTENNEINCPFCQLKHPVPENGFASNKTISQMLNLRAHEVYRSSRVEKLKLKLARVCELTGDFKFQLENSAAIVSEHCRGVKDDVNTLIEAKKTELEDMRSVLLSKIDNYEQDCLNNIQKINAQALAEQIAQMNKFASECRDYLNGFELNEKVVNEQNRAAKDRIGNLEKLLSELKGTHFCGQLLKFKQDETAKIQPIGKFVFDTLDLPKDMKVDHFSLEPGE